MTTRTLVPAILGMLILATPVFAGNIGSAPAPFANVPPAAAMTVPEKCGSLE